MKQVFGIISFLAFTLAWQTSFSQGSCPDNIGFERGNFTNWNCFIGTVTSAAGVYATLSSPIDNRHTILKNTIPQEKDIFGNFPVNCPNGSGYSIKLGNYSVAAEADRVTYTFMVPADKNEYSIIYNYAIVFQNPNHLPEEQPKFTSRVFDQSAGQYLSCGAFEYVASSGLPGFQQSTLDNTVFYKPWSPVTIKLIGCAGKLITLEFTVNDCTRGGHFGYAYLDVNENCAAPISGNVYCNGAKSVTLQAPFGFQAYNWYSSDFSKFYGNSHSLMLDPIPPVGTRFAVEIIPYPGLGCPDTLYTTITKSDQAFNLVLADTVHQCLGFPANLTLPSVSQGSSPGLTFSYHLDSAAQEYLPTPSHVTDGGLYFIKAVNSAGCNETQPVQLLFRDLNFKINDPPPGCSPKTVDITLPGVTSGSDPALALTYWLDNNATVPLPAPSAVDTSGTYFIKATNAICSKTEPVQVKLYEANDVVVHSATGCGSADLTHTSVTTGTDPLFKFSYWRDSLAATSVVNPKQVQLSGDYYIKASVSPACYFMKAVPVFIKPLPDFSITNPAKVIAPDKASILQAASSINQYTYSYWRDLQATKPLASPGSIELSGTYYIKAIDTAGCVQIQPVQVTVEVPYHPVIRFPNAFSPNGDGINDRFRVNITGNITFRGLTIFDRWGQKVFTTRNAAEYWPGEKNGKQFPPGTYYWMLELVNNNNQEFYRRNGTITLLR